MFPHCYLLFECISPPLIKYNTMGLLSGLSETSSSLIELIQIGTRGLMHLITGYAATDMSLVLIVQVSWSG